jgi:pyrroline-5-carboxylate reductase
VIVAVIGAGKIGEAVARSLAKARAVQRVYVTKRTLSPATKRNMGHSKLVLTTDNAEAAARSDVIVLSVKAGDAKHVLDEIAPHAKKKVVISLMAAISITKLESHLPSAKVVRAMPNIAAAVGEAITAYTLGSKFSSDDDEDDKDKQVHRGPREPHERRDRALRERAGIHRGAHRGHGERGPQGGDP